MPPVTGNEDHDISLDDAAAMTKRSRQASPGGPLGQYLGRGILDRILAQSGCVGLRMYYAQKDNGEQTLVVTGVDSNGNDLYQGVLAEQTWPCPPICAAANPLNS